MPTGPAQVILWDTPRQQCSYCFPCDVGKANKADKRNQSFVRRLKEFFISFTSAAPSNIWETSSALLQWLLNLPVYPFLPSLKMLCPALNQTGSHLHSYLSKVKVIECALKIEGKSAKGAKSSVHCNNEDFALCYWDCLNQFHKCVCESDFCHQDCSFYSGAVCVTFHRDSTGALQHDLVQI